ncbi:MAG: hypothetical protein CMK83_16465 [Pseudomonadales bacterium]|jgi:hypothetical protein|nr:hypothetical protein [Pseudomonadales bacterium]MEC8810981.1 hypothetical protein [Pseudomonadota bacterium]HAG93887.1 hypothetical protein [Gammaproteobacteria bacterium]HBO91706.1 hypothetical protein [Gammaproteobacteria bacterium]HCB39909.1 hypothetical protein [Gammaproteobacteria bacterium]|tara:strand:- start:14810 stop:16102 length:1293 start_codon:yes stop_codon:yes gene_type:complete
METVLLGVSLLVFGALTINCLRLAFGESLSWGLACTLFPASWIPFYGARWHATQVQGVLHGVSLIAVLLFGALFIRSNPFLFDGHPLSAVRDYVAPAYAQSPLLLSSETYASDYDIKRRVRATGIGYGRYLGADYRFEQVVFADGMLRFKQLGKDEILEIAIELQDFDVAGSGNLVLDLTPDSDNFPLVHVLQYRPQSALPSVQSFERDYWMELYLDRVSDNRYQGEILLKLPDGRNGFLAGNFTASTKDVIWEFGDVVRSYDSNDTIEYIARQYLINNLGTSLDKVVGFDDTFYQTSLETFTGHTDVQLVMVDGSVHDIRIQLYKNEKEWVVERSPVRELIGALQTIQKAPPASIKQEPMLAVLETFGEKDLDELIGRNVELITHDGKVREGLVDSVDRYNVSLVRYLDAGEVAMMVRRREVKAVRLKD